MWLKHIQKAATRVLLEPRYGAVFSLCVIVHPSYCEAWMSVEDTSPYGRGWRHWNKIKSWIEAVGVRQRMDMPLILDTRRAAAGPQQPSSLLNIPAGKTSRGRIIRRYSLPKMSSGSSQHHLLLLSQRPGRFAGSTPSALHETIRITVVHNESLMSRAHSSL
jgi:hypothetical protein